MHFALGSAVVAITTALDDLYVLLYSAGIFLNDVESTRLREICCDIGRNYMMLRADARRTFKLRWRITPKVHKVMHLPMYGEVMNPRFLHLYAEESLIGTTCRIWQRCMRGRYRRFIQQNVLLRRLLGLILRMESDLP